MKANILLWYNSNSTTLRKPPIIKAPRYLFQYGRSSPFNTARYWLSSHSTVSTAHPGEVNVCKGEGGGVALTLWRISPSIPIFLAPSSIPSPSRQAMLGYFHLPPIHSSMTLSEGKQSYPLVFVTFACVECRRNLSTSEVRAGKFPPFVRHSCRAFTFLGRWPAGGREKPMIFFFFLSNNVFLWRFNCIVSWTDLMWRQQSFETWTAFTRSSWGRFKR